MFGKSIKQIKVDNSSFSSSDFLIKSYSIYIILCFLERVRLDAVYPQASFIKFSICSTEKGILSSKIRETL